MASEDGTFEDDLRPTMYGVSAVFLSLVTLAVALRFVSRRLGGIPLRLDDLFLYLAYFFYVVFIAVSIALGIYGDGGRRTTYILLTDPGKLVVILKIAFTLSMLYLLAAILPKLALLALFLDVFIQKPLRIACWVCIGILVASWFAGTVALFKICTPFSHYWDVLEVSGSATCLDVNTYTRWISFPNIVTDLVMLILPIPMVLSLQVSTAVRIGVGTTFVLGGSGLIASIMRFVFFYTIDVVGDLTYNSVNLVIWTQMEVGMYIIAACLITYNPLLRKLGFRIGMKPTRETARRSSTDDKLVTNNIKNARPYHFEAKPTHLGGSYVNGSDEEDKDALPDTHHCPSTTTINGVEASLTDYTTEWIGDDLHKLDVPREGEIKVQKDTIVQRI